MAVCSLSSILQIIQMNTLLIHTHSQAELTTIKSSYSQVKCFLIAVVCFPFILHLVQTDMTTSLDDCRVHCPDIFGASHLQHISTIYSNINPQFCCPFLHCKPTGTTNKVPSACLMLPAVPPFLQYCPMPPPLKILVPAGVDRV